MLEDLPKGAELLAQNEVVQLVLIAGRKVHPYVIIRGNFIEVYHHNRETADLCLDRRRKCLDCVATESDCRNKEKEVLR